MIVVYMQPYLTSLFCWTSPGQDHLPTVLKPNCRIILRTMWEKRRRMEIITM